MPTDPYGCKEQVYDKFVGDSFLREITLIEWRKIIVFACSTPSHASHPRRLVELRQAPDTLTIWGDVRQAGAGKPHAPAGFASPSERRHCAARTPRFRPSWNANDDPKPLSRLSPRERCGSYRHRESYQNQRKKCDEPVLDNKRLTSRDQFLDSIPVAFFGFGPREEDRIEQRVRRLQPDFWCACVRRLRCGHGQGSGKRDGLCW